MKIELYRIKETAENLEEVAHGIAQQAILLWGRSEGEFEFHPRYIENILHLTRRLSENCDAILKDVRGLKKTIPTPS
jgi:hypothetical protein